MTKQLGILNSSDFQQIRLIVREEVKAEVTEQLDYQLKDLVTKSDITSLKGDMLLLASKKDLTQTNQKIAFLPTKTQFYKKMDRWMKATTTKELEKSAHKSNHDRTEKRLTRIESHIGITLAY